MGMYGNYIAVENSELDEILKDNNKLLTINVEDNFTLDIDKSWQAIYYTLCDDIADGEPPLSYIVPLDGILIKLEDNDFSIFCLTANQVKEAVDAMNHISIDDFQSMYNFDDLIENEVYPSSTKDDNAEEFLRYLTDNFEAIRKFYKEVYDKNRSIIFYIS